MISIDFEDAQAIAYNIEENLRHDEYYDREFWQVILNRLNQALTQEQ